MVRFALRPALFEIPWNVPNALIPDTQIWSVSLFRPPVFGIQGCRKWKKSERTEWSQNELEHIRVKLPCIHSVITGGTPKAQTLIPLSLLADYDIQGCQISEWTQTNLNTSIAVKTTLYTLNTCSRGPNLSPFRSTDIVHFIISHWLPRPPPRKKSYIL